MINELAAHGETKQNLQRQIVKLERERDNRSNTNRVQCALLEKKLKRVNDENRVNAKKIKLQRNQIGKLEGALEKSQSETNLQKEEIKKIETEKRKLQSNNAKLNSQLQKEKNS